MKKMYLLPLLALFFTACSVDDSSEILDQEKIQDADYSNTRFAATAANETKDGKDGPGLVCFNDLAAHISMNVSGGLNNPIINFVADVPLNVSYNTAYMVKVEVQQLADCEDFNVVTGDPIFFGGGKYTNVVMASPTITVLPNELPACYKWRMTFERTGRLVTPCKTISQWYDAPLF